MPVVQFVRELNEKATAAGYDEAKLARLIPLQLSGAAKIKYDNYAADIRSDYRKILDQLKKDFRSPNYVEMVKSEIYSIKQELTVVFGQRVKDLAADAYAESSPIKIEEIACETFVCEKSFSVPPIFHSEISRLRSIVAMTSKHPNAQNYGKNSNGYRSDFLNDELHKLSVEGLQYATSIEENAKDVLQSQAKFIFETVSFRVIAIISSVVILIAVLFSAWICYYFSCIKIMRKCCKSTTKKQQRIETITMQNVDDDNAEENKKHATFNKNRMNTTKFLSYVPIVMSIINSAEAKTCYPCFIPVFCKGTPIVALVDTGSSITFLDEKTLSHLKASITREKIPPAKAANRSEIPFIGHTQIPTVFGNQTIAQKVMITKSFCPAPLVVGMDLLYRINTPIRFDMQRKMISIGRATIPILRDNETGYLRRIFTVTMTENILIPSRSDNFVMGEIDFLFDKEVELIAEDNKSDDLPEGVIVGKTLHCPALTKQFPFRILNTSNVKMQLYKGQKIANAEVTERCSGLYKRVFSVYEDDKKTPKTVDIVRKEVNYVLPEVEIDYPTDTMITGEIWEIEKINWEHSQLDLHQKTAVVDMANDFRDIFVSKSGKLGRYSGKIHHRIDLIENSKTPKQKPYRVPLEQRKEVLQQIQELLKHRVIEKSSSPFCAPIILVKKKDQTWRFVVDYHKLNSITKSETYFIPNIQEIIDLASGKAFYTTVDFKSGLHQIPMEKSHRERTAFQTFLGLLHFITMPMGLKGAPGTFQKVANSLIRELRIPSNVTAVKSFLGAASYFRLYRCLYRSDLSGRLAKYQVAIMGYDAIIQYRPGKQNAVSDALSRYPNETVVNSVQVTELASWEEIKDAQKAIPYNERI
ncbi:hypothetical protein ANCCAN_14169 [Ancylostoma caninum]|uniref:Reverse transcriptase domain-containing protein n=1 Tax=Ancylostoma caninum TaxID=29170 RepID=A0A368G9C7_ANCCA|nr:hypothetical protein ANCCAN_14169 [Ancylostoma caninum]